MYFVSKTVGCLVLLVVQVIVLNNIHLFGVATPLLYIYAIIVARRDFPRWALLVLAFLLGLGADVFSNTPGVATCSLTLLAFIQPYLLALFLPRDSADDFTPAISSLGFLRFVYFAMVLTFVYCIVFYTLEMFSFFNWTIWLESVAGSTILTLLIMLVVDNLKH